MRAGDPGVDADRLRLRGLDGCLSLLEEAHERGKRVVEVDLLAGIRTLVPGIQPGMPIREALDRVFRAQSVCMRHLVAGRRRLHDHPGGVGFRSEHQSARIVGLLPGWDQPLNEVSARHLTERIRSTARRTCLLLLEAHQRRAWLALGYRSWEQYVQREFDMSRRRSYELLDQGRVVQSIQLAARMPQPPAISAYAALQIKGQLSAVTETVRQRAAGLPRRQATIVINEIVQQARLRTNGRHEQSAPDAADQPDQTGQPGGTPVLPLKALEGGRCADPAWARDASGPELHRFLYAVESLSRMPPVGVIMAAIPDGDAVQLAGLNCALDWLSEFASRWATRSVKSSLPMMQYDRSLIRGARPG